MHRYFIGLLISLALWTAPAQAQNPGLSTPQLDHLSQRLELSPEQRAEFAEILFAADAELIDIQARARQAELRLTHHLDAPEPNRKAVMKAVAELGKANSAALQNRTSLLLELKNVVDDEQWGRLKRLHRHPFNEGRSEGSAAPTVGRQGPEEHHGPMVPPGPPGSPQKGPGPAPIAPHPSESPPEGPPIERGEAVPQPDP